MTKNEAFWAVQNVTEIPGEDKQGEAERLLVTLTTMDNFIGGRIIPPQERGHWMVEEPAKVWKVQTIHEDCGEENAANLPDGLRRVLVLPSMFLMFGIKRGYTISEWLSIGKSQVACGVTEPIITDRSPLLDNGSYTWEYGWRWLEPSLECVRYTLPTALRGFVPGSNWFSTPEAAQAALNQGAFAWASKRLEEAEDTQ